MSKKFYIGIDVGGTKIAAALVKPSGTIVERLKESTPRPSKPKKVLTALIEIIRDLLDEENISIRDIKGIGIGIPGIVDTEHDEIIAAPNIALTKFPLKKELQKKFFVPIKLGNDVNCGILGEQWLGCARGVRNVVGIFPGTGIGGGVIMNGILLTGYKGAATELGHMIIDPAGPQCTCGNRGCLEAYAGRWAIQRDLYQAMHAGKKTVLHDLLEKKNKVIKSKILAKALKKKDALVRTIMNKAFTMFGFGCISIRHAFSPEIIVLGGGLIEACGDFILPVVKNVVNRDPFFAKVGTCQIVQSTLGDDAVILGAVALVRNN